MFGYWDHESREMPDTLAKQLDVIPDWRGRGRCPSHRKTREATSGSSVFAEKWRRTSFETTELDGGIQSVSRAIHDRLMATADLVNPRNAGLKETLDAARTDLMRWVHLVGQLITDPADRSEYIRSNDFKAIFPVLGRLTELQTTELYKALSLGVKMSHKKFANTGNQIAMTRHTFHRLPTGILDGGWGARAHLKEHGCPFLKESIDGKNAFRAFVSECLEFIATHWTAPLDDEVTEDFTVCNRLVTEAERNSSPLDRWKK